MPYFTLTAGNGVFLSQTALDPKIKATAEAWADLQVNDLLFAWDRALWTGAGLPLQVAEAAELLASGKYLERVFGTGNPDSNEGKQSSKLMKEGLEMLEYIIDSGGPIDPSDSSQRLAPIRESVSRRIRMTPG